MQQLYLECYFGISGDMSVAALLDLGVSEESLLETLKELKMEDEFSIAISKVMKAGIEANDFDVILHHGKHHEHRNLADVNHILDRISNEKIKMLAKKIFSIVAESEAKAHGKGINEVHFHEVGAVDSIVDIVSVAHCIAELNIDDVYVSPLYEGCGFITCAHGKMPVPVPAVLNIVTDYHLPIKITDREGEFITPTGAAIVAALKTKEELPEQYVIKKVGLGAGKRYSEYPSMVRAMLIERKD